MQNTKKTQMRRPGGSRSPQGRMYAENFSNVSGIICSDARKMNRAPKPNGNKENGLKSNKFINVCNLTAYLSN